MDLFPSSKCLWKENDKPGNRLAEPLWDDAGLTLIVEACRRAGGWWAVSSRGNSLFLQRPIAVSPSSDRQVDIGKSAYAASMHSAEESWTGARQLERVQLRMSTMTDELTLVFCIYIRRPVSSWNPSGPSFHSNSPRSCEMWRNWTKLFKKKLCFSPLTGG